MYSWVRRAFNSVKDALFLPDESGTFSLDELLRAEAEVHPLQRSYSEPDLLAPLFFDELASLHPLVLVDFPSPDFDADWALAGERLREMGDTVAMEAVS